MYNLFIYNLKDFWTKEQRTKNKDKRTKNKEQRQKTKERETRNTERGTRNKKRLRQTVKETVDAALIIMKSVGTRSAEQTLF